MMKTIYLFIVALCSFTTAVMAQRPINIDSLRRVMTHLDQKPPSFANDTAQINTLLEVTIYHTMYSDSGFYFLAKTLQLAQKKNWPKGIGMAYLQMAYSYEAKQEVENSINYARKALTISLNHKEKVIEADCYMFFAGQYHNRKNYPLAIHYLEKAYAVSLQIHDYSRTPMVLNNIGSIYSDWGKRQKAFDYFQRSLTMARQHRQPLAEAMSLSNVGDILKDSVGHEAKGIQYINQSNQLFKQLNRPVFLADGLETIGHFYLEKKQYATALPYMQEAWDTYHKFNWSQGLDQSHNFDKSLYQIHKALRHPDKALFHLEQYTALLDSTLQAEIKSGRDIVQMQLDKEKQQRQMDRPRIRALEQEKIAQNRTRQGLLLGLGFLSLVALGIGWYNRKLKTQNALLHEKNNLISEVTRKIQTTEIAALRAQMNPHFIFNCLNSIQFFTAQNNADKATDYLAKFARLIRLVLENSKSDKVTLANELATLRLYIEMEAMRFPDKLHYQVQLDEAVDAESIQIPPLLLQPFVENAIWHGLMHKDEGGTVRVSVEQPTEERLRVTITDDGIGRARAAEFKSKSATKNKSFGMKITAERIDLINQLYQTHTEVQVEDLLDDHGQPAGTRVTVEIPV